MRQQSYYPVVLHFGLVKVDDRLENLKTKNKSSVLPHLVESLLVIEVAISLVSTEHLNEAINFFYKFHAYSNFDPAVVL